MPTPFRLTSTAAALALAVTLSLTTLPSACSKSPRPAAAPSPSASASPTPTTAPSPSASPAPAARAILLRHGAMTYVMDTPPNQLRKAQAALESSDLVTQLGALGVAVTYQADASLGDAVVVLAGSTELGRADLHDLDAERAPAALLDAIKAHFAIAP